VLKSRSSPSSVFSRTMSSTLSLTEPLSMSHYSRTEETEGPYR
jgi:hypothetical protein